MNTMDNAKVIEAIEKFTIFNYFEKLLEVKMRRITLFSIFPYTAAANLSDPRHFMIIENLDNLTTLNCGRCDN